MIDVMSASWARRARYWRSHPRGVDFLLAVVLAALSVLGLWVADDYAPVGLRLRDPDVLAVALMLASTLPLAWRRERPVAVFAVVTAASMVLSVLAYPQLLSGVAVLIALYTGATCLGRRASLGLLTAAVAAAAVVALTDAFPSTAIDVVASTALFFGAWAFGRSIRLRRAYTAELEERAAHLERAREAGTRAALAEERTRIARELHDVVAHHVSVMTVQAAAARRVLGRDPDRAGEAMAAVEQTGRAALAEMRTIVGVLRQDADDGACFPRTSHERGNSNGVTAPRTLAPQPGVADVPALVEQVREAGLDVELRRQGHPRPLPAGEDLAIYRVVQEALTNSLKHAGPTRAEVTLAYDRDELVVRVGDRGRGAAAALTAAPDAAGHGLLGMRERVEAHGGHLHAGPRPGGGYEVLARLPVPADPPPARAAPPDPLPAAGP